MNKNRNSFNWILGIGYLVIGFIIFINFITPKNDKKNIVQVKPTQPKADEIEVLKQQLEEERRVKREMSELIARLQATLETKSIPELEHTLEQKPLAPNDLEEFLKKDFEKAMLLRRKAEPVSTGKNPFVPFREKNIVLTHSKETHATVRLSTNPDIPLTHLNTWNPPKTFNSLR